MPHPSGASHKYDPAWMEREKRAEGGKIDPDQERRNHTMDAVFGALKPGGNRPAHHGPDNLSMDEKRDRTMEATTRALRPPMERGGESASDALDSEE